MMKVVFYFLLIFCVLNVKAQTYSHAVESESRVQRVFATVPVIDKLFENRAVSAHYPGFVYGIVVDGKLIHTGSIGYTNLAKKIPATSKSAFRIASMSESFTCMAVVKLRDEGKLSLDDYAYKYIPQMKGMKYLTSDARPITVRDLMIHAAGFPEDNPWGDRQLADTEEQLTKLIEAGVSFSNIPGITFEYSNLGYALLGRIITNISKKPYHLYINENILKPLGMNNTWWEYKDVPSSVLAHGYRWINGNWREEELLHHGSHSAMGGIITTIEDFAKYIAFHQSAWPPNDENDNGPIKKSSLREMHKAWNISDLNPDFIYPGGRKCPSVLAYGYGLSWQKDCENRVIIGHGGGLPGFGSHWRFLPDYGIGIVSFSNVTYGGTGGVNLHVLDTVISLARLKPRAIPISPILHQRMKELVKFLPDWNGAEKSGIFAENFFADNIIDSLRKQSKEIFNRVGKIISPGELIPENQLRGTFSLIGERGYVRVYFTLTPENPALIQAFRITWSPR